MTCALKVLTDPRTAAEELHEVVQAVWAEQRPGYIEIHRDMVDQEIEVPAELIAWDGQLHFRPSDPRQVEEAARETVAMFNAARKPALIAGIEIHRYKLARELITLAERMGAPVLSTVLGKGAFPMDHPLFMGVQVADISAPPIVERMAEADLVINLGCLKTDMNFGNQPPNIVRERSIWAVDRHVDVRFHTYTDVSIRDFVHALLQHDFKTRAEEVSYADNLNSHAPELDTAPLRVRDMLRELNRFLADHQNYGVVAESGDMLFAGLDVRVPRGGLYLAQGFYASMGFAVPAAMGAQVGSGVRPVVLCGDGAFQMTGPEISHAPMLGANPIVIVVNNSGWQIFRPDRRPPRVIGHSAMALRQTGRGLGRSRLRRAHPGRTARGAGVRAREQDLRDYRRQSRGRRSVADNGQIHPSRRAALPSPRSGPSAQSGVSGLPPSSIGVRHAPAPRTSTQDSGIPRPDPHPLTFRPAAFGFATSPIE